MSKDKGSKNTKKVALNDKNKSVSAYKSESKSKFAPIELSAMKPVGSGSAKK